MEKRQAIYEEEAYREWAANGQAQGAGKGK